MISSDRLLELEAILSVYSLILQIKTSRFPPWNAARSGVTMIAVASTVSLHTLEKLCGAVLLFSKGRRCRYWTLAACVQHTREQTYHDQSHR
jgi:hypothetical protein